MTAAPVRTAPKRLGRFELRRAIGRGAQAVVWLAFDARLEREVALKLLARDAGRAAVDEWLHEARAVSRLNHPHIVPVFEADEHAGQPYLVFEYVPGATLAELLRTRGALPAAEAATMMLGVLDALRVAHGSGIVHRDLKPSNILIDGDGRARVMDFGIAARVSDAGRETGSIVGTPGYMSPEAARGEPPSPAMDVFAIGVMLAEMLAGRPLRRERDPLRAVQLAIDEPLALPPELDAQADDRLCAIVRRAMAHDAAQRHGSAAELHAALAQWLQPKADDAAAGGATGTLEFLLRRMRHKTDFPALSDSVSRIQRVADSEHENLHNLAAEILKDVALTNKLLRVVNSAHFSHAGGGTISTVSRAVALVGFAGIRNMALSLVLLEHMQNKAHAQQLKEEFLRSLAAGSLATELCPDARDGEEAFIGAMFQNLGRLLTEFYFPEEAQQVRRLQAPPPTPGAAPPPGEDAAAARVLGLTFEEIGLGVAKSWGLPDGLQRAMRKPAGDAPAQLPPRGPERLRWIGVAANEVVDAMLSGAADDVAASAQRAAARFARTLQVGERDLRVAVEQARERVSQIARAMNLKVAPRSPAQRLLAGAPAAPAPPALDDTLAPHQLQATMPMPLDDPAMPAENVAEVLAAGIQDITNHMVVENFRLNEVLRMILETMYRALGFRRVVFCLRDPRSDTMTGRFGLGDDVERVQAAFKVPLRLPSGTVPDLFSAVCIKGADTLISDATVPNIATRLPGWFHEAVKAPAFLLLPLAMRNAPFALIYADKARPGGIALGEKELSLLRTLRNQAVMAFRQSAA